MVAETQGEGMSAMPQHAREKSKTAFHTVLALVGKLRGFGEIEDRNLDGPHRLEFLLGKPQEFVSDLGRARLLTALGADTGRDILHQKVLALFLVSEGHHPFFRRSTAENAFHEESPLYSILNLLNVH
jgi:hypothetical protein